jgi:serine/threonine-protein kinase
VLASVSGPVGAQVELVFSDDFEQSFADCPDCPVMVWIPAGQFIQGSPVDEFGSQSSERPRRSVEIPTFAIGQTEVTFDEWDACVADGGCSYDPSEPGWGRGSRPVINVSRTDAREFAAWLSDKTGRDYRLPSESEWEYAARAGTLGRFHTGDCITSDEANFNGGDPAQGCPAGDRPGLTLPVASYAPNAFGLYDMHGNVEEWVRDCWNENYAGAPTDGSAWLDGDCSLGVPRGGWWGSSARTVRSAYRKGVIREARGLSNGFRVAISPR